MGGKSGGAPPPPDYTSLANSSREAAEIQAALGAQQLDWAKEQYADQKPMTEAYLTSMMANTDAQTANAQTDRARYEETYQPVEDAFLKKAQEFNSPVRAEQDAAGAMADVGAAFEAQRRTALTSLESYGIDPSETRFAALDLGTRVSQAAAQAAAGTQARRNTEGTALALQGEAINIGRGYPGQVAQSYAGATTAGNAGVTAGLNTSSTYGNLMGTAPTYYGLANQSRTGAMNAMNTGYGNALGGAQLSQQADANNAAGVGSMVGGAIAIGGIAVAI